jgi:hypothetical protein
LIQNNIILDSNMPKELVMSPEQARKKDEARREAIQNTYCINAAGLRGMAHPAYDDPSAPGKVNEPMISPPGNNGTKMEYA